MAFKSFKETEDGASERGLSNLNLINNPFQNALISSYQAANLASQAPNPFMAALSGAAVGAQQLQSNQMNNLEMANFEDVAPQMATQFPQLAKLRASVAYPILKEMIIEKQQQEGRMEILKSKPQDILDAQDIPAIQFTLKSKGYTDQEIQQYTPSLLGQSWGVVKGIKPKAEMGMIDVPPTVEKLPNGLEVVKTKTKFGSRYQVLPGQILGEVERSRIPLANEALREAEVIKGLVTSPKGYSLILKAGGDYGKLASFGDDDSQRLYRAVKKMADARMRVLTGAAANQSEVAMYFSDFFSRLYSPETILSNIDQEKTFFNDYLGTLTKGRNLGAEQPTSMPKSQQTGGFSDDAFDKFMGN